MLGCFITQKIFFINEKKTNSGKEKYKRKKKEIIT